MDRQLRVSQNDSKPRPIGASSLAGSCSHKSGSHFDNRPLRHARSTTRFFQTNATPDTENTPWFLFWPQKNSAMIKHASLSDCAQFGYRRFPFDTDTAHSLQWPRRRKSSWCCYAGIHPPLWLTWDTDTSNTLIVFVTSLLWQPVN